MLSTINTCWWERLTINNDQFTNKSCVTTVVMIKCTGELRNQFRTFVNMLPIIGCGLILFASIFLWRKLTLWRRQGVPTDLTLLWNQVNHPVHVCDHEAVKKHGKIVGWLVNCVATALMLWLDRFFTFLRPSLLIADKDLAKKVLQTDFHNFVNHFKMAREDDYFGENLFTLNDEKWKQVGRRWLAAGLISWLIMSNAVTTNYDTCVHVEQVESDAVFDGRVHCQLHWSSERERLHRYWHEAVLARIDAGHHFNYCFRYNGECGNY